MEARGRRAEIGCGLSAISWGESERKILLVHGWESRATQMSGFVDSLLNLNYQVVALDGPGHGQSKEGKSNPYLFARAVKHITKKLGPFEGVVGHSIGGNAVATALSDGVTIPKVVLISTPASISTVLKGVCQYMSLPNTCSQLFFNFVEREVGVSADIMNTANNVSSRNPRGLLIHDTEDVEISFKESKLIAQNWPQAEVFSTSGYGHKRLLRNPDVWNKVSLFFFED